MIRVTALYPTGDGLKFDIDYFEKHHVPMVGRLMGDALKGAGIEKGVAAIEPGQPAPFMASGYLEFESVEVFRSEFERHAEAILADIPKFTNAQPILQIAEIVQRT